MPLRARVAAARWRIIWAARTKRKPGRGADRSVRERRRRGRFEGVLITATGCAAHLLKDEYLFLDEPDGRRGRGRFAAKLRDFCVLSPPLAGEVDRPAAEAVGEVAGPPPSRHCAVGTSPVNGGGKHGQPARRVAGAVFAAEWVALARGGRLVGRGVRRAAHTGGASVLRLGRQLQHLAAGHRGALRDRKLANIALRATGVVATANIGCLPHLSGPDAPPVVHLAELIDWAEGGPMPKRWRSRAVDGADGRRGLEFPHAPSHPCSRRRLRERRRRTRPEARRNTKPRRGELDPLFALANASRRRMRSPSRRRSSRHFSIRAAPPSIC